MIRINNPTKSMAAAEQPLDQQPLGVGGLLPPKTVTSIEETISQIAMASCVRNPSGTPQPLLV